MNKWMKKVVAWSFIVAQFLVIPNVSASSLDDVRSRKQSVEEQVVELQKEVNTGLEEVSAITVALSELNQEIEEHKATITQTEEDIVEQEELVEQRYEYTADQLVAMQKNEVNKNIVLSLLQSESLSDLLNKIYSASILTGASEERLTEAQEEQDKLTQLRETLLAEKENLDAKQVAVVEQKELLYVKVAELKNTLAASQTELENLTAEEAEIIRVAAEREAAAKRAAEEAARTRAAEAARVAQAEKAAQETQAAQEAQSAEVSVASTSKNNSLPATATPASKPAASAPAPKPAPAPAPTSNASGWRTMQATGYSTQQPGLSTHTRIGVDLRINPQVIAVDPNVIPLGSLVEVEGLGVYLAGDTGGAIKGNIIDIHYPTVQQALNWGRRTVRIRVLN